MPENEQCENSILHMLQSQPPTCCNAFTSFALFSPKIIIHGDKNETPHFRHTMSKCFPSKQGTLRFQMFTFYPFLTQKIRQKFFKSPAAVNYV